MSSSTDPASLRHRALASAVRVQLLSVLDEAGEATVEALSDAVGRHVNTVRAHLAVLRRAELVEVVAEARDRPGRPRLRYRRATAGTAPAPGIDERWLIDALTAHVAATAADASAVGLAAGHAVGTDLPPDAAASGDDATALDWLVGWLDDAGFAPRLDRDDDASRIVLRRCPFADTARAHPDVVCSLHLGVMRGALARLDSPVGVRDLLPWAVPDGCVAHLEMVDD